MKDIENQIQSLAETAATAWGYSKDKDNILDVVKTLHGKVVYGYPDDLHPYSETLGSIDIKNKEDFTIYVSEITSSRVNNFTIAHELGHYVLHSSLGEKPSKYAHNKNAKHNAKLQEYESNLFACAFLMPKDAFTKIYKKSKDNAHNIENYLAVIFNTTEEVTSLRISQLNLT